MPTLEWSEALSSPQADPRRPERVEHPLQESLVLNLAAGQNLRHRSMCTRSIVRRGLVWTCIIGPLGAALAAICSARSPSAAVLRGI